MGDLGTTPSDSGGTGAAVPSGTPSLAEIRAFRARLEMSCGDHDDADRIDRLRALEELRCTTEAAQSEVTADFTTSMRAAAAARGVRSERRDRGMGSQVALARRESPTRGSQDIALAMVLRTEMPCTRAAFRAGRIDRWKVTIIARETACLSPEHRATVDESVCGDLDEVEGLSLGQLYGRLAQMAAKLDPAAVAERRRRAESDRHTSLRPAPDTMTWFRALLRVKDGVAVHAALDREARRLRAAGDERPLGQLRADLLVAWVTHQGLTSDPADAPPTGSRLPVMVNVVVPGTVLLGDDHGTGWVDDLGPVPGDLIREWVAENLSDEAERADVAVWLRRVYADPAGGLVAMDSSARRFNGRLAEFLRLRDQRCRTPYCDAPVRHLDHVVAVADGGPTIAENGQGTCEQCNYAKQADGWQARPRPGPRHTVETTTPTGHTYVSVAPDLTG